MLLAACAPEHVVICVSVLTQLWIFWRRLLHCSSPPATPQGICVLAQGTVGLHTYPYNPAPCTSLSPRRPIAEARRARCRPWRCSTRHGGMRAPRCEDGDGSGARQVGVRIGICTGVRAVRTGNVGDKE
ncbi:hypothetical protein B0H15DRAFT_840597 [Mycena belliarum]|uniref:Uncharacterized protein n=1 Tax=Mycena belliarum TaxID=1033014 RepID=A0AAD6U851_9AGAR|nr:hypothetical protein B0H15DRAFT_840597 [Mycena belliae]